MTHWKRWSVLLAVLAACAALAGAVWAQASPGHDLSWHIVGSGGAGMDSPGHTVRSTLGQFAIGPAAGPDHSLGSGYWYGATRLYRVYLPVVVKAY